MPASTLTRTDVRAGDAILKRSPKRCGRTSSLGLDWDQFCSIDHGGCTPTQAPGSARLPLTAAQTMSRRALWLALALLPCWRLPAPRRCPGLRLLCSEPSSHRLRGQRAQALEQIVGRYAHFDVVAYQEPMRGAPMRTFISYGFTEFRFEAASSSRPIASATPNTGSTARG